MTAESDDHDPSEIVVDELVGQWIALLPVSVGASIAGVGFAALWPGIVTAFLAFRLFDIWKPPPIRRLEKLPGGFGVMADDVMAGAYGALVLYLAGRWKIY